MKFLCTADPGGQLNGISVAADIHFADARLAHDSVAAGHRLPTRYVFGVGPYSNRHTGRVYLDPCGEKLRKDLIRAPRVSYKQAHALYG